MEALKLSIGGTKIAKPDRARLVDYGKRRAKEGAGPAALAIDVSFIRTVLSESVRVVDREGRAQTPN